MRILSLTLAGLGLAAALSVAAAGAAFANCTVTPPAPAAQPAKPPPANDPNQTICRHMETTGSRIPGPKVCHTRQQWADLSGHARDSVDSAQARGELTPTFMGK